MAVTDIERYLELIPAIKAAPERQVWMFYDDEVDTLYINFRKPSEATDSELTDDDVIVRYHDEEIVGLTILHAGNR